MSSLNLTDPHRWDLADVVHILESSEYTRRVLERTAHTKSKLSQFNNEKTWNDIRATVENRLNALANHGRDEFGATRRGQGGYDREQVSLLIAKFIHRQSRSQDPQLHAHCLVLNTARREDGSLGTIDAGPLLQAKKLIGAYFRSALASELGIPLEADQKFSFRVPGVPEPLSEHWSSGAQRIEEAAKERGVVGGKAKAQIALETRRAKDERPLSEMRPEWEKTARAYGFTARDVERIFGEAQAQQKKSGRTSPPRRSRRSSTLLLRKASPSTPRSRRTSGRWT